MRYRILEFLIAVGVIAFAIVSLNCADPLFETLFFSFTLGVILASLLLSIGRRAGTRAFWFAFAATSSLYLAFAHVPDSDQAVPRHNGPEVTTQILRLAYNWLHSDSFDTNFSAQPGDGFFSIQDDPTGTPGNDMPRGANYETSLSLIFGVGQRVISSGDSISFMRIGHSAWALLLGWISGHFTRVVYERSRRQPS